MLSEPGRDFAQRQTYGCRRKATPQAGREGTCEARSRRGEGVPGSSRGRAARARERCGPRYGLGRLRQTLGGIHSGSLDAVAVVALCIAVFLANALGRLSRMPGLPRNFPSDFAAVSDPRSPRVDG